MNKIITLELLKNLEKYFKDNINNEIEYYNVEFGTSLQKINNITYNAIKKQLPELYIGIEQTNFEYEDFSSVGNVKITNNFYISLAYRTNEFDFQDNVERYIYILINMLEKYTDENVLLLLIKNCKRGELQSENMQTIKIINIDFDIITNK